MIKHKGDILCGGEYPFEYQWVCSDCGFKSDIGSLIVAKLEGQLHIEKTQVRRSWEDEALDLLEEIDAAVRDFHNVWRTEPLSPNLNLAERAANLLKEKL